MNWDISRNYAERRKLFESAQAMENQRKAEVEALPDELTDEAWEKALEEIHERFNTLPIHLKIMALEYPKTRNEWFINFVKSFGVCQDRRITRKQGDIFARYGEPNHERESGRGLSYCVRVENLFVKCTLFSIHEPAYVTITEV